MFHSSTALRSVSHQNIPPSLINPHHHHNHHLNHHHHHHPNATNTSQTFPDLKIGATHSYSSSRSHQKQPSKKIPTTLRIEQHHSRLSAAGPAEAIEEVKVRKATTENRRGGALNPAAAEALLPSSLTLTKSTLTLTAVVTVRRKRHPSPNEVALDRIDALADSAGQKVFLQLVSADVDKGKCCNTIDPAPAPGKNINKQNMYSNNSK